MARQSREKAARGREIAHTFPPAKKSTARKRKALGSLAYFAKTYFPDVFTLPFSGDHYTVIATIETTIRTGGRVALAMPRGSGKTALCLVAVLWAILSGLARFVVLVGESNEAAVEMLESIRTKIETNDELLSDWPDLFWPIRCLEGITQRRLLYNGESIKIKITQNRISFPSLPRTTGSESTIVVAGLTGRIRGRKITLSDGSELRPDLVIADDPQNDESAHSPGQNTRRERLIKGTILGLAGPGKRITVICPCTVIAPGDLSDRLMDSSLSPDWVAIRTKLVNEWPKGDVAEACWAKYKEIRMESLRLKRGPKAENDYYKANREVMDCGSDVPWKERYKPDEISALQHAYNLLFQDEEVFQAEYQNSPRRAGSDDSTSLIAERIAGRHNTLKRHQLPVDAQDVTAFIDVQGTLLYYVVCAWARDFSGCVIDYGSWPEQTQRYWTLGNAKRTLETLYPKLPIEQQLASGLTDLTIQLAARKYTRPDGATIRIGRMGVDSNWGPQAETVYQWCASQTARENNAIPTHGKFVGASSNPMNQWNSKPGDLVGNNWRVPALAPGKLVRHINYDVNAWKTFLANRLLMPIEHRGAMTFFGPESTDHRMFADHCCAEYRVSVTARGRTVDELKERPNRPDNHWWDGLIGCAVLASVQGCRAQAPSVQPAPASNQPRRSRVTYH